MKVIEITASYTFKKNLGNYQSADFFLSAKAEVGEKDNLEAVSLALHAFCRDQVEKATMNYIGSGAATQGQDKVSPPVDRTWYQKDRLYCKKCKSQVGPCRLGGCDNCDFCGTSPETEWPSGNWPGPEDRQDQPE